MKRFAFAALAALSLFAFSCTEIPEEEPIDDDPIDKPDDKPDPKPGEDSITITTQGEIVIPASGGSATVAFTASGDWTASVEGGGSSWLVAKGVTLATRDQFKFRKDHDWQVNYGGGPGTPNPYVVTLDSELTAGQGGSNLSVPSAGVYDLLLDPNAALYKVVSHVDGAYSDFNGASDWSVIGEIAATGDKWTADVPMYSSGAWLTVNPASGGKGTGSITVIASANNEAERTTTVTITCGTKSATFTVRQPEDKGFIADFKGEYKVSAAAQTIELKARANVELSAESQADWITVAETKVLVEKTIVLSIAANTGGARTGTVTVSAPELGLTQTVTVAQAGAGEIYIPDNIFFSYLLQNYDTDGDGTLSQAECLKVDRIYISGWQMPSVNEIESLAGLEFFPNLKSLTIDNGGTNNPVCKVSGTLDLSGNPLLDALSLNGFPLLEKIDLSGCPKIWSISLRGQWNGTFDALKEIILPEGAASNLHEVDIMYAPALGPELDLSNCYDMNRVAIYECGALSNLYLPTGYPYTLENIESHVTIGYKGENVYEEYLFTDPVLKQVLIASDLMHLDYNADGKISRRDLEMCEYVQIYGYHFNGIQGNITTLEDLGAFKNVIQLWIRDCSDRVTAQLPESLSALSKMKYIIFENSSIGGSFPASYANLTSIIHATFSNTNISGNFPDFFLQLPEIEALYITDNPGMSGAVNLNYPENTKLDYIYLTGCNFDSIIVAADTPEKLLDHTVYVGYYPQLNADAHLLYRSANDGTGSVHADGEAVLYHAATKGPGLDFFITGDGFTAANNTVGGTLEIYLKYAAECIMAMEPFNKLMDYFNIWLIYAHSQNEGTAIGTQSTDGLKFSSYQPSGRTSTCIGDWDAITEFVSTSTGRNEPSGTAAVIMNSPQYGGMCFMKQVSLHQPGISIGMIPAAQNFEWTLFHEVMGHGFAYLGDEYSAEQASEDQNPVDYSSRWTQYGSGANLDSESNPSRVKWSAFLTDTRYANEGLGVFEGANLSNTGWYRPSGNSIMRDQTEEDGHRFNAPSREAIWQRVQVLTHPENNWSSWADYIANGYNREEFVEFDLAPAPDGKKARAPRALRRASLPAGAPVPPTPRHAPPIIVTE